MNDVKWWVIGAGVAILALVIVLWPGSQASEDGLSVVGPESPAEAVEVPTVALIQHEVFVGEPDKPVLFVIEEDHASLAVQQDVASAIQLIAAVLPEAVLLIEGSEPKGLDFAARAAEIADPMWMVVTAEAWFELGWLSGAELAGLRLPELAVWGVEHPSGAERTAHWEALQQQPNVWDKAFTLYEKLRQVWDLEALLVALWLVEEGVLTEEGVRELVAPWDWDAFVASLMLIEAAEALEEPLVDGLHLEEAMGQVSDRMERVRSAYQALADLRDELDPVADSYSARWEEWQTVRQRFFKALVTAAVEYDLLDREEKEDLLCRFDQAQDELSATAARRHGNIIENSANALDQEDSDGGILVIGAGHTSELTAALRNEGISHVVVTPVSLATRTPAREKARFEELHDRWWEGKPVDPVTEWLTQGAFNPPLTLSDPRSLEAFSAMSLLLETAHSALRDRPVPAVPAGDVVEQVKVVRTPQSFEISVVGRSGRSFIWELRHDFPLTAPAARELVKHVFEALEAGELVMPRADGFFSPAVHLYLEPDGVHGGAFVSYMPDSSTLVTRVASLELPAPASALLEEHQHLLRVPSIEHLDDLLRPIKVLRPVVDSLNRTLDELGIPHDQLVPVVLRWGRISDEARLRDINFTLLAEVARQLGIEGFERPLLFVKPGMERDSEHIKVGSPERLLASTLANVHAWAATQKHIAVFTIPTEGSEEEWANNPFAQYLVQYMGVDLEWYDSNILRPYVEVAIYAIGPENVLQPRNLDQFMEQLEAALADVPDATVTLSLVAHKVEERPGLWVHFRDSESEVPFYRVVSEIRLLQEQGRIPASANLEFNVIVCSAEEGAVPQFIKQLDARLVLASPHEIGVATNMRLLAMEATRLGQGMPAYQAYLEAVEALVREFLQGVDIPSLLLTEPYAVEEAAQAKRAAL